LDCPEDLFTWVIKAGKQLAPQWQRGLSPKCSIGSGGGHRPPLQEFCGGLAPPFAGKSGRHPEAVEAK